MAAALSDHDRAVYEWQLDIPGFGESGQTRLRQATALVTRAGGLGGPLCLSLAAAGIGKLIIAHGGNLRRDDLNRQILMSHAGIGKPRAEGIAETLRRFNPEIELSVVAENINESNVARLTEGADIIFGAAPLFEERLLLNRESARLGIPLVDCAMYGLECRVIPIVPGRTPCLACLYPEVPPHWRRRFPVLGAVSALAANIGAIEGIKILTSLGEAQLGRMIYLDTAAMNFQKIRIKRNPACQICSHLW